MKKPDSKSTSEEVIRSRDVPATAGMLYDVRDELLHKIDSRFHELKLLIEEQNARVILNEVKDLGPSLPASPTAARTSLLG